MAKVVIERPRWRHGAPSMKTGMRIHNYDPNNEYEDSPQRINAAHNRNDKMFSDFLNPLFRYLHKNVGRPWDKVYSEMREHLDFRSTTGRHVFEHVKQYVSLHCFIGDDGKVYENPRFGKAQSATGLFVHPRTKLLCWRGKKSWQKSQRAKIAAQPVTCIPISDNQYHIKLKGIWYIAELTSGYRSVIELHAAGYAKPEMFECYEYNSSLKLSRYWRSDDKRCYWILSKRQLNAKELKAAKLSNDVADNN